MNKQTLNNYIAKRIIKKQYENEYRLRRPIKITVTKRVVDLLKNIYKEDYEEGGLLEAQIAANSSIVIDNIIFVPNQSKKGYSYSPNIKYFNSVVDSIIDRGNLPIAIHTHPLRLGIESYDNKRAKFYLKPSRADKSIAREGITDYFNFPEAIFTVDERLENGFGFSFFTGFIFPASNQGISSFQWIAFGAAMLGVFLKNEFIATSSMGLFLLDFFRRPNYKLLENGNLLIELSE